MTDKTATQFLSPYDNSLLLHRTYRSFSRITAKLGLTNPPACYPFTQIMQRHKTGYPWYRWGTLCAAQLASSLGYEKISVIEFGVAGGNGLLRLESFAEEAERLFDIGIDVYGFDTGEGLTKPQDYRDLPQLFLENDYRMDVPKLKTRLKRAQLVLGPVAETVPDFLQRDPAPVGFVSFDLDLYSSTMDAFQLFDAETRNLLPRIVCYFDDVIGFSYNEYNGELRAIREFNEAQNKKISQIPGLRYMLKNDWQWTEKMYMFHDFQHRRYNDFDGTNYHRDDRAIV